MPVVPTDMRKLLILAIILSGCKSVAPLQKSRLIAVSHLMETSKYNEAKGVVEDLIANEKMAKQARVWVVRGNLCLVSYFEGERKNDKKLTELYPNQLYTAYESYEKAISLAGSDALRKQVRPKYVQMINGFQKLGENQFKNRRPDAALKAFETAMEISQKPFVSLQPDTSLMYNTALAAYESSNWEKATRYLWQLNETKPSLQLSQLLFEALLQNADTIRAKVILQENIERINDSETLVLMFADYYLRSGDFKEAVRVLDQAIGIRPSNSALFAAKGLAYEHADDNRNALLSYTEALKHAPDNVQIMLSLATCYYNQGVEIEVKSRAISNRSYFQTEKDRAASSFNSAVTLLDEVYATQPADKATISKMQYLYKMLHISEKAAILEKKLLNGP